MTETQPADKTTCTFCFEVKDDLHKFEWPPFTGQQAHVCGDCEEMYESQQD